MALGVWAFVGSIMGESEIHFTFEPGKIHIRLRAPSIREGEGAPQIHQRTVCGGGR